MSQQYPQHEKVKAIKHLSQSVHEFMEFLFKKGIHLAEETRNGRLEHSNERHDDLIAEFFEIDLKEFHKEKDRMYEEMVAHSKERSK